MDPSEAFAMILRHRESMINPSSSQGNRYNNGVQPAPPPPLPPYPQQHYHHQPSTGGHYGGMTFSYGGGNGSGNSFVPPYPQETKTTYNQHQQWQPSPPPLPPPQPAPGNQYAPVVSGYQIQNNNPPYQHLTSGSFVGGADHYPIYPNAPILSSTTQHYPDYTGYPSASPNGGYVFHTNQVGYTIPAASSSSHNKGPGQKKKNFTHESHDRIYNSNSSNNSRSDSHWK